MTVEGKFQNPDIRGLYVFAAPNYSCACHMSTDQAKIGIFMKVFQRNISIVSHSLFSLRPRPNLSYSCVNVRAFAKPLG